MKDWFPGFLHLILNTHASFIVGLYRIAQLKGQADNFMRTIEQAGVCRNIKKVGLTVKVKISESGIFSDILSFS